MNKDEDIFQQPIKVDIWDSNKNNGVYVDIHFVTFKGVKQKCYLKKRFFRSDAYFYESTETGKETFFCKVKEAEKVDIVNTFLGIGPAKKGKSYFEEYLKSISLNTSNMELSNIPIKILRGMAKESADAFGNALIAHTKLPNLENERIMLFYKSNLAEIEKAINNHKSN